MMYQDLHDRQAQGTRRFFGADSQANLLSLARASASGVKQKQRTVSGGFLFKPGFNGCRLDV
ncbi:hypothetical protein EGK14_15940 [Erwinia sp. 198]|nr:hypothetical protein EGK14_15940 [Erwinia sp. 198]